jgi:hypothetical protein
MGSPCWYPRSARKRRGLVWRASVPVDGRASRVLLTEAGRQLAEKFVSEVNDQLYALTDDLSDTNRHRLSLLASALIHRHAAAHGIDLSTTTARRQPLDR